MFLTTIKLRLSNHSVLAGGLTIGIHYQSKSDCVPAQTDSSVIGHFNYIVTG